MNPFLLIPEALIPMMNQSIKEQPGEDHHKDQKTITSLQGNVLETQAAVNTNFVPLSLDCLRRKKTKSVSSKPQLGPVELDCGKCSSQAVFMQVHSCSTCSLSTSFSRLPQAKEDQKCFVKATAWTC